MYGGQNQSSDFDYWPKMCTQWHLWLDLTVILTTLNNTKQCFYQSKTVKSFWPVSLHVLHVRFDRVRLLSAIDIHCTLARISTFWLTLTLAVTEGLIMYGKSLFKQVGTCVYTAHRSTRTCSYTNMYTVHVHVCSQYNVVTSLKPLLVILTK